MTAKTRVKLEVGAYNKGEHYAVIGDPTTYYLWYKPKGQRGEHSKWITGHVAFAHYNKMRELLVINKDEKAFVSYLEDLYHANVKSRTVEFKKTA